MQNKPVSLSKIQNQAEAVNKLIPKVNEVEKSLDMIEAASQSNFDEDLAQVQTNMKKIINRYEIAQVK